MARIAGNKGHYQLSLVDSSGKAHGVSVPLPSVTTILSVMPKNGLDWWGYKIGLMAALELADGERLPAIDIDRLYEEAKRTQHTPQKALKAAGGRGTAAHDVAEQLLKGEVSVGSLASDGSYIDALLSWYESVKGYEVVAVEIPVFSLNHRYSGTLDYILRDPFDATYVFGDFKTSKAVYDSHLIQLAAYRHAASELGLIPLGAKTRMEVVRLGVDGSHEVVPSDKTIADFLVVKSMWEMLNERRAA